MTDFRPGTGGDIQVVGSILDDAAVRESWRFWYEADSGAPVRFESDQDGQHFEGVRTEMDGHSMPVSCAGLPAEHAAALDGTWGPDGPMEYPKTEPSTGEVIRQVRDDPELAEFQDYVRRHGDPLLLAVSYDDGQTYGDDSTRWWLTFVSPGADELVDVFCSGRPPTLPILSAAPECQAAARNGTLDWLRPDPGPMTSVAHWRDVIDMLGGWSIDNWGMHRSDTSIILDFVNGPKNIHGIDHRLTVDSMSGQISSWDGWVAR